MIKNDFSSVCFICEYFINNKNCLTFFDKKPIIGSNKVQRRQRMHVNFNKDYIPEKVIIAAVKAINTAVSDNIKEDFLSNEFVTTNSYATRVWEYINRNINREFPPELCTVVRAHRGPWEFMIIYDKQSGHIMTIMRGTRFNELQKSMRTRNTAHYIQLLAEEFNSELMPGYEQLSFEQDTKENIDMKAASAEVRKLLCGLSEENEPIKNHVLVLFDTAGGHLVNIKSVKVTPKLQIVAGSECDWSKYISATESVIVEKVSETESASDKPDHGLKLTGKAVARRNKRNNKADKIITDNTEKEELN